MKLEEIDPFVRQLVAATAWPHDARLWTDVMLAAFMGLHEAQPERDSFTVRELLAEVERTTPRLPADLS